MRKFAVLLALAAPFGVHAQPGPQGGGGGGGGGGGITTQQAQAAALALVTTAPGGLAGSSDPRFVAAALTAATIATALGGPPYLASNPAGYVTASQADLAGAAAAVQAALVAEASTARAAEGLALPAAQKGATNGVAPLVGGLVPAGNLPAQTGGAPYTLPIAGTALGGVKQGAGANVSIDGTGVPSVPAGAFDASGAAAAVQSALNSEASTARAAEGLALPAAQKGAASGVAPLVAGVVPTANLPPVSITSVATLTGAPSAAALVSAIQASLNSAGYLTTATLPAATTSTPGVLTTTQAAAAAPVQAVATLGGNITIAQLIAVLKPYIVTSFNTLNGDVGFVPGPCATGTATPGCVSNLGNVSINPANGAMTAPAGGGSVALTPVPVTLTGATVTVAGTTRWFQSLGTAELTTAQMINLPTPAQVGAGNTILFTFRGVVDSLAFSPATAAWINTGSVYAPFTLISDGTNFDRAQ